MAVEQIERVVTMIRASEGNIGLLSCGEQIAAALIFNRPEWFPPAYAHPLDAIIRLGVDWFSAVVEYHQTH